MFSNKHFNLALQALFSHLPYILTIIEDNTFGFCSSLFLKTLNKIHTLYSPQWGKYSTLTFGQPQRIGIRE